MMTLLLPRHSEPNFIVILRAKPEGSRGKSCLLRDSSLSAQNDRKEYGILRFTQDDIVLPWDPLFTSFTQDD
jgi:hypothetical protein